MPRLPSSSSLLLAAFAAGLVILQVAHPLYPGNDLANPKGFFGWYDQSEYLKQLTNLVCCSASEKAQWVYPAGLTLLSWPLAKFAASNGVGLVALSLLSFFAAFALVSRYFSSTRLAVLLGLVLLMLRQSSLLSNSVFVVWSSCVTLLGAALLIRFAHRLELSRAPWYQLLGCSAVVAVVFATRPQDGLILMSGFVIWTIKDVRLSRSTCRSLALFASLPILVGTISYMAVGRFIPGGIYATTPHVFQFDEAFVKFIGIVNGDPGYGIDGESIREHSRLFGTAFLFLIAYFLLNAPRRLSAALLVYLAVYFAFSDFGYHNIVRFSLFHYLKLPFLLALGYFIADISWMGARKLLMPSLAAALLSQVGVDYRFVNKECDVERSAKQIALVSCSKGRATHIYLEGVMLGFPGGLFDRYDVAVNGETVQFLTDFRMFRANQGAILYLFEGPDVESLSVALPAAASSSGPIKPAFYRREITFSLFGRRVV